ncbi:DUF1653 domain-containing protein [Paenibacillus sp. GCM10027627]|uniref:DUF1653 domain-containing protein n=1 Tax=unclassified Paenibacillus TaxID=185978 RepID=UPI003641A657
MGFTGVYTGIEIVSGQRFKHYSGNIYTLFNIATHTETEETLVVYHDENYKIWARPIDMFFGYLEDGQKRFTLLNEEEDLLDEAETN